MPVDFASVAITGCLPDYFVVDRGQTMPEALIGATILHIGTPIVDRAIEGGGLVIDFVPADSFVAHRCVFGFNETGMWLEFEGPLLR